MRLITFVMDLRGLNIEQVDVVLNHLRDPTNYVTIREVQNDFIKIEVSETQHVVLALAGSLKGYRGLDGLRQCLAGMVDSACKQRSDLFMPNAHYGWLGRIWHSPDKRKRHFGAVLIVPHSIP